MSIYKQRLILLEHELEKLRKIKAKSGTNICNEAIAEMERDIEELKYSMNAHENHRRGKF